MEVEQVSVFLTVSSVRMRSVQPGQGEMVRVGVGETERAQVVVVSAVGEMGEPVTVGSRHCG